MQYWFFKDRVLSVEINADGVDGLAWIYEGQIEESDLSKWVATIHSRDNSLHMDKLFSHVSSLNNGILQVNRILSDRRQSATAA